MTPRGLRGAFQISREEGALYQPKSVYVLFEGLLVQIKFDLAYVVVQQLSTS